MAGLGALPGITGQRGRLPMRTSCAVPAMRSGTNTTDAAGAYQGPASRDPWRLRLAAHLARAGGARYCGGQAASAKAHAAARHSGQRQRFVTRRHAKDETIAWLLWYNKARLHSTLAYVSSMQFEQTWLAAQPRQASS